MTKYCHVTLVTLESFVAGNYSAIIKDTECISGKFHLWEGNSNGTLEDLKRFYSNIIDYKVLSYRDGEGFGKFHYLQDYKFSAGISNGDDWNLSEEAVRSILSEEEWNTLLNDGIVEPKNCYVQLHTKRDGWYCPRTDYFTKVELL